MKNFINYFYNLNVDNIRQINNNYYFKYLNKNFVFYQIVNLLLEPESILEINNIILQHNNGNFYQIVMNKDKKIITNVYNKKYVLMLENATDDRIIDYYDVIDSNFSITKLNKAIDHSNKLDWVPMWQNKIDYFETYINHNINKYPELNVYYNYFIGLSEAANLYLKNTIKDVEPSMEDNFVISHKRISNNTSLKQLYNPVELIIDHPSRDLSEYLKMIFWNKNYQNEDIGQYLENTIHSNYGARVLFSRMLFPSFFFDAFENLVNDKIKTTDILSMVDKMNDYEDYIFTIYDRLNQMYSIPSVDWIKKADYSSTLTTPKTSGISFTSIDSMPSLSVTSIMLQWLQAPRSFI